MHHLADSGTLEGHLSADAASTESSAIVKVRLSFAGPAGSSVHAAVLRDRPVRPNWMSALSSVQATGRVGAARQ